MSHFTGIKEPGVDAHGDLHLSIPLMTVPGRDGLNFEIAAQYRSGIKVTQSASWMGLGWELDLGSVTRQSLGGLDNEKHVDWARSLLDQMTSQPDAYSVNMNGNSTLLIATLLNTVPTPAFPYDPAKSETTGPCSGSDYKQKHFIPSPWRPWKICANGDTPVTKDGNTTSQETNNKNDISYFNIATEDGSRYIYKLPTLSSEKFPNDPGTTGDRYKFVSTWRLSAILSPNYSGPEIPDATSTGGWVKITYRTWRKGVVSGQESELNAKEVATVNENELPSQPIIAQLTYPYYVETPTHFAVFKTSKRYDRDLANLPSTAYDGPDTSFYSRKLGRIKLYKKTQYLGVPVITNGQPVENFGTPIMEVSFKYLKNGADSLQTYSNSIHGQMLSKLTLLEIAVKGRKGSDSLSIPAYKFSYWDYKDLYSGGFLSWHDVTNNAAFGNNSLYYYQDDFGFLDIPSGTHYNPNESQGITWSLQTIVYPEGGSHKILYESDSLTSLSLSYASYNNGTQACTSNVIKQFAKIKQGGPRVKTIRIYTMGEGAGSPPADSITFKYHNGRRSAIADVKFYKLLGYGTSGSPLYFAGDRGQANIAYEWVEKKLMDGSRIRTFYRTTDGAEPQLLYWGTNANQKVIYSGNTRWNWA
ncbi:MAG: hypothetical protein L0287_21145, partial [Anaerolineae bacterium]|nr:hypothetical protein [Anaerolineae bacterium]